MHRRPAAGGWSVVLGLMLLGLTPVRAEQPNSTVVQDRVIAGGPNDFMEVRHLVLKGRNEDIGRALATIARDRYSARLFSSRDPFRTHAQRHYLEKNYPILVERMRGVAASYGKSLDDDSINFSGLPYQPHAVKGSGCSVVQYPAGTTTLGTPIVSRNYDFTTGTMFGTRPGPGQLGWTARPYLLELHPDKGYASIAMWAYDLLSGALDGMNSEGLTVALLADDELMERFRMEPTRGPAVGLGALQMIGYLLDNCATVEEAKEALLTTKQYYEFLSVHYLVADRSGKAFVWEYSQAHNREYIIENPGKPLITTNFSLHRYMNGNSPPSVEQAKKVCPRYCALAKRTAETGGKASVEAIKECQHLVDAVGASRPSSNRAPARTLWHALYFPEQLKMQVSFYLHDDPADASGKPKIVRSDYLEFALAGERGQRVAGSRPR